MPRTTTADRGASTTTVVPVVSIVSAVMVAAAGSACVSCDKSNVFEIAVLLRNVSTVLMASVMLATSCSVVMACGPSRVRAPRPYVVRSGLSGVPRHTVLLHGDPGRRPRPRHRR